jgi:hypothetical protein
MGEESKLSFRVMGCILITGSKQRTVRNYLYFLHTRLEEGLENGTPGKNNRFNVACVYRSFVNKV